MPRGAVMAFHILFNFFISSRLGAPDHLISMVCIGASENQSLV